MCGVLHIFCFILEDGPENCSEVDVDCDVIPSAMDNSKVDVQIQLFPNRHFMCAVEFLVQFNGENKTVPFDSSSVNFTIDNERERHTLQGMIYTLDNESRTGQNSCLFSISGTFKY